MDYPSIDIDKTTERERREVSAMFEEDVELAPDHFERDYCVFKVKSVNGIEPSKTIHVLFCNDRPYLIPEGGDEDYKGCLLCKVFLDSHDKRSCSIDFMSGPHASRDRGCRVVGDKVSLFDMVERSLLWSDTHGFYYDHPV